MMVLCAEKKHPTKSALLYNIMLKTILGEPKYWWSVMTCRRQQNWLYVQKNNNDGGKFYTWRCYVLKKSILQNPHIIWGVDKKKSQLHLSGSGQKKKANSTTFFQSRRSTPKNWACHGQTSSFRYIVWFLSLTQISGSETTLFTDFMILVGGFNLKNWVFQQKTTGFKCDHFYLRMQTYVDFFISFSDSIGSNNMVKSSTIFWITSLILELFLSKVTFDGNFWNKSILLHIPTINGSKIPISIKYPFIPIFCTSNQGEIAFWNFQHLQNTSCPI